LWLSVSAVLRRLRLDRIVHWLPGVRRGTERDDLVADRHVARWFTVEIFHLLGFRKQRDRQEQIVFSRRREQY